jgi:spore coat protein U-like protein
MNRRTILAVLLTASTFAAALSVRADSIGTRMDVTANVLANCRLVVPPLSFGTYDPLVAHATAPADALTVLSLTCTRNTAATVSFDFGIHTFGGEDRGLGGNGQDRLHYQIYRDSARSLVWSKGGDAIRTISRGVSQPDQLTVFGRIPPRQEVEPGAYLDVLTAMVDF